MSLINKYPDGSSYADTTGIGSDVRLFINNYEDLWHLTQVVNAFNLRDITPVITIPNLIDAQADRKFGGNQSTGLKIVGRHLNSLRAEFKVFHPHNAEVVEALMDNVEIIDNSEFVKVILHQLGVLNRPSKSCNCSHIKFCKYGRLEGDTYCWDSDKKDSESYNENNLILMSTDAGGFKPLMKLCDKINWEGETFSASKSRKYEESKSKLIQQIDREDFGGKDILLIDDICVKGGTFIGLAKMLRERNAGKIYLAVSHITVETLSEELVNSFDMIFTTNSKNYDYVVEGNGHDKVGYTPENLKVIKLF